MPKRTPRKTNYKFRTDHFDSQVIDLDEIAGKKDADLLLKFGGAELVIQYRLENAGRIGHPFIDIVVGVGDEPMSVDLCREDGAPIRQQKKSDPPVVQILLGQKTRT